MKKLLGILILLMAFSLKTIKLRADANYLSFESIEIQEGKFLKDFTKAEYKQYYKRVNKRKFWGWQVYTVHEDVKVTYKTETIFSYHNDGTTAITYDYKFEGTKTATRSISSTGNIDVGVSGSVQKFKGGLDASLKSTQTSETTEKQTESFKMSMQIDPKTMANLYIYGEGKITNGVAKRYIFWIGFDQGGFEVFLITTQYYRLEKVRI